jgi:hypothetical protein
MSGTEGNAAPPPERRPVRDRLDITWLAVAALVLACAAVTAALRVLQAPSVAAAAAAYGVALAVAMLLLYLVDLVGEIAGWPVVIDVDRAHLPRGIRSPVLPFVVLVLGLLVGHFVW